jgi:putative DNA primase/helicase
LHWNGSARLLAQKELSCLEETGLRNTLIPRNAETQQFRLRIIVRDGWREKFPPGQQPGWVHVSVTGNGALTSRKLADSSTRKRPSPILDGGGFTTPDNVEELAAAKLALSGITLDDARRAGIEWHGAARTVSVTPTAWPLPSLYIPYFQPSSERLPLSAIPGALPFYRIRTLREPVPARKDFPKYLQSTDSGCCAYFPATTEWDKVIHNGFEDIVFVEGELKALKASLVGFNAIGLGGVNSFISNRSGKKDLLPELGVFKWVQRRAYIVFDNDHAASAKTIKNVNDAADMLADLLMTLGVSVFRVHLPEIEGLTKTGLDDFLVNFGGDAFQQLLEEAEQFYAPPKTENALARAFVKRNQDRLRFCQSTGKWHLWSGCAWRPDEARLVFGEVGDLCREVARRPGIDPKTRTSLERASTSAGAERFAQSHGLMAVTSKIWDADPWRLGTPGGTVDLRTGKLSPSNPDDYITKLAAVAPDEKAHCKLWRKFLSEITQRDKELIRFFQQWYGSSLTGDTRDQAFVFIYGPGGNGKSVMNNVIRWILGNYAVTATMALFTASPQERHTTDLAMLDGARMVTAAETQRGRKWDEQLLKQMTGGDQITARFLYRDNTSFVPQFKPTIIGNHKPIIETVDDAMKRRTNIAPVTWKPPPEAKDLDLENKLRAEGPGILRWLIEGCLDWQKNGLVKPKIVLDETAEYFETADTFAQWARERCVLGPKEKDTPAMLLINHNEWLEANSERQISRTQFKASIERQAGLRYKTVNGQNVVEGIRLLDWRTELKNELGAVVLKPKPKKVKF